MMEDGSPRLVVCAPIGEASGVVAMAAALAVSATRGRAEAGVALIDLRSSARPLRGSVLASSQARSIESLCGEHPGLRPAARGRVCFLTAAGEPSVRERAELLGELLSPGLGIGLVVAVCDPPDFRGLIGSGVSSRRAVLLKAARDSDRPLIALLAAELRAEGVPAKVWVPAIGPVGARRALAGLDPGGDTARRAARLSSALLAIRASRRLPAGTVLRSERAQALPAVLGIAILIVALALILVAIGGAATAKGRLQRSADLAAISAARSMRDDFERLFVPARLPDGAPNPAHLERAEYLGRARLAATTAAEQNDLDPDLVEVGFPDRHSFAPLQVRVEAGGEIGIEDMGDTEGTEGTKGTKGTLGRFADADPVTSADAKAEVTLAAASGTGQPTMAEGGGYAGPLAYRQGEPMRPDVAIAFDRLAAAARGAGVALVINSAYRSDSEQQRLWDANPDPRWVAPPGTSLHRCGTELDLGPSSAYGWLAANASRFGFTQRYAWEAWHFGFVDGPEPCSAEGDRVAAGGARSDGAAAGGQGLPGFVPSRYRAPLLAAQLMAESNFNPNAVSPAGAQGIAQFMPATAASYGLDDPYDAIAAIEAQARMMGALLKQFGSVELALAAYNAGPGAVAACDCVPPYPETQAYVARILALLDGAGALAAPSPVLEVRLIG
jgi:hypothetical protein